MSTASIPDGVDGLFETYGERCEWGCKQQNGLHLHCRLCGKSFAKSEQQMSDHYDEHHTTKPKVKQPQVSSQQEGRRRGKPCAVEGEPHYHLNWPFLEKMLMYFIDFDTDTVYGEGKFIPSDCEKSGLKSLLNQYVCLDSFLQELPSDAIPYIMEMQEKFCQIPPFMPEGNSNARSYVHVSNFLLFVLVASRWSASCAAFQNELLEALCHMSFPSVNCWRRQNEDCRLRVFRAGQPVTSAAEPRRYAVSVKEVQTTFTYHVDGILDITSASMKIKSDQLTGQNTEQGKVLDHFVAKAHTPGTAQAANATKVTIEQGGTALDLEVVPSDAKELPQSVVQQIPNNVLSLRSVGQVQIPYDNVNTVPQYQHVLADPAQGGFSVTPSEVNLSNYSNMNLAQYTMPPPPPPLPPPMQPAPFLPQGLSYVPENSFLPGLSHINKSTGGGQFYPPSYNYGHGLQNVPSMNRPPYGVGFINVPNGNHNSYSGSGIQHSYQRMPINFLPTTRNFNEQPTLLPPTLPPLPNSMFNMLAEETRQSPTVEDNKQKKNSKQKTGSVKTGKETKESSGKNKKPSPPPPNNSVKKHKTNSGSDVKSTEKGAVRGTYLLDRKQASYKNFWDKVSAMTPVIVEDKTLKTVASDTVNALQKQPKDKCIDSDRNLPNEGLMEDTSSVTDSQSDNVHDKNSSDAQGSQTEAAYLKDTATEKDPQLEKGRVDSVDESSLLKPPEECHVAGDVSDINTEESRDNKPDESSEKCPSAEVTAGEISDLNDVSDIKIEESQDNKPDESSEKCSSAEVSAGKISDSKDVSNIKIEVSQDKKSDESREKCSSAEVSVGEISDSKGSLVEAEAEIRSVTHTNDNKVDTADNNLCDKLDTASENETTQDQTQDTCNTESADSEKETRISNDNDHMVVDSDQRQEDRSSSNDKPSIDNVAKDSQENELMSAHNEMLGGGDESSLLKPPEECHVAGNVSDIKTEESQDNKPDESSEKCSSADENSSEQEKTDTSQVQNSETTKSEEMVCNNDKEESHRKICDHVDSDDKTENMLQKQVAEKVETSEVTNENAETINNESSVIIDKTKEKSSDLNLENTPEDQVLELCEKSGTFVLKSDRTESNINQVEEGESKASGPTVNEESIEGQLKPGSSTVEDQLKPVSSSKDLSKPVSSSSEDQLKPVTDVRMQVKDEIRDHSKKEDAQSQKSQSGNSKGHAPENLEKTAKTDDQGATITGDSVIDKKDEAEIIDIIQKGQCRTPHCSECFTMFDTQKYADLHAVLHRLAVDEGQAGKLRCISCSLNGHFWYLMVKHLSHHHGDRLINSTNSCLLCGLSFDSKTKLEFHQGFHFNSKLYRCIYCGIVRGSWLLMQEHLEKCTIYMKSPVQHYFSCPYCNQKMYTSEERLLHVHSHTDSGFLCIICKIQKTYGWAPLKRHYLCGHFYKTDGSLKLTLPIDLQHSCHRQEVYTLPNSELTTVRLKDALCPIATYSGAYKCIYNCDVFLETKTYAKLHNQLHTLVELEACVGSYSSRDPFQCPHCNFCSNNWFLILNHLKRVHNDVHVDTDTGCYLCGLTFSSPEELDKHQESHANNRLKCVLCSKPFNNWQNLKDHQPSCPKSQDLPNYPCAFCYIVFRRKEERELHMNSHADTGFRCTCCEEFDEDQTSWTFLKKHYMQEHDLSVYSKKKSFKCPDCDKVYKNSKGVKQHHFSIHQGGVRSCPHCEKKFKSTDAMRVHIDSKHGYRINAICEVCGFEAENEKLLMAHQKADHKTKQHKCEKCNDSFAEPAELEKHTNEAHPRDPNSVQCGLCKIWLAGSKQLKRHKLYQHNPHRIPMRCTMCGYRSFKKLDLKNHMIKKHDLGAPDPDLKKEVKQKSKSTSRNNRSSETGQRRSRKRRDSGDSEGSLNEDQNSPRKRVRRSSKNEESTIQPLTDVYSFKRHMSIYTTPRARASALAKMERLQKATEKQEDERVKIEARKIKRKTAKVKAKAREERRLKKRKSPKTEKPPPKDESKSKKERKRRNTKEDSSTKDKEKLKEKSKKTKEKKEKEKNEKNPKESSPQSEGKKKEKKPTFTHRYRPLSEPHCDHSYCRRPVQENPEFYTYSLSKEDLEERDWMVHEDEIYGVEIETSPVKYADLSHTQDPYGELVLNVPQNIHDDLENGSYGENSQTSLAAVVGSFSATDSTKSIALSIVNDGLHSSLQIAPSSSAAAATGKLPVQVENIPQLPASDHAHTDAFTSLSSENSLADIPQLPLSSQAPTSSIVTQSLTNKHDNMQGAFENSMDDDDVEIPHQVDSENSNSDSFDADLTFDHSYASRSQPIEQQQMSCETVEEAVSVMQNMVSEAEPEMFQDFLQSETSQEGDSGIHNTSTDVIDTDMLPNMDILDALMQQSVQDNEELLSFYEKD